MTEVRPGYPRLSARSWLDVLLAVAVIGGGLLEAIAEIPAGTVGTAAGRCLVAVGIGAAVAVHRRHPGLALALVWVTCGLQLLTRQDLMLCELTIVIVAYGTARYGSAPVLRASLLSVPAGYAIALVAIRQYGVDGIPGLALQSAAERLIEGGIRPQAVVIGAAAAVLLLPWLLGFALRMRDRAVTSQAVSAVAERARAEAEDQRAQAQQLAELRAEQTRLARDVHDVVGHSLAVILAQAQSGDYLPGDDPERLKQAMRNIADSARASLADVRRILTETSGDPRAAAGERQGLDPPVGDLDRLLDDVRTAGLDIRETVTGTAGPLPPDLATVAYRVMQEMLTNTIKHGVPGGPVYVRRDWTDGLAIEVSNTGRADEQETTGGRGLDGMRQRLAAAAGTLTVSREREIFTARAWLPRPSGR